MKPKSVTCLVRASEADGDFAIDGEVLATCAGGDADGSSCLELNIAHARGGMVVTLDGDETRRLRAQIDEALRGPGVRR